MSNSVGFQPGTPKESDCQVTPNVFRFRPFQNLQKISLELRGVEPGTDHLLSLKSDSLTVWPRGQALRCLLKILMIFLNNSGALWPRMPISELNLTFDPKNIPTKFRPEIPKRSGDIARTDRRTDGQTDRQTDRQTKHSHKVAFAT